MNTPESCRACGACERNAAVGDLRVLRRDFSPLWFIAANHVLTWQLLRAGIAKLRRRASAPPAG